MSSPYQHYFTLDHDVVRLRVYICVKGLTLGDETWYSPDLLVFSLPSCSSQPTSIGKHTSLTPSSTNHLTSSRDPCTLSTQAPHSPPAQPSRALAPITRTGRADRQSGPQTHSTLSSRDQNCVRLASFQTAHSTNPHVLPPYPASRSSHMIEILRGAAGSKIQRPLMIAKHGRSQSDDHETAFAANVDVYMSRNHRGGQKNRVC